MLYVDDDAPEGGDGSSWDAAFSRLQDALDVAADSPPGVQISEVRVAQGTYKPDANKSSPAGSGDRQATFRLITGVALRGGYAGLAAGQGQDPDQRDVDLFQTILSGDLADDDAPPDPDDPPPPGSLNAGAILNMEENSFQVVTALNVDETAVLNGFVIRAGRADGPGLGAVPESRDQGSGMNVYFSSPTIVDCTFEGNWALNHGALNDHGDETVLMSCTFRDNYAQGFGAGLYVHHHSATMAVGCAFEGNQTPGDGAGAYSRSEHHAMLMDCTFINNAAEQRGGGFYGDPESNTMLMDCAFCNNAADFGAAMYNDESLPVITGCTFMANEAIVGGAGIYNNLGDATISECVFPVNVGYFHASQGGGGGGGGSGGGGVWNSGGTPLIIDCEFTDNFASFGAGVYSGDDSLPAIVNCVFMSNHASEGAGVYNLNSDAYVTACAFEDNHVEGGDFSVGGGISTYFCDAVVTNCSFTRNSAWLGGGAMYNEGDKPFVMGCIFHGNRTTGPDQGWGGGILNSFACNPLIVNCEMVGNQANRGGGIFNTVFSGSTIINCTIAANEAVGDGGDVKMPGGGGGIYDDNNNATLLANSIVWANTPQQISGSAIDVLYSCVQDGFAGAGNVQADAQFMVVPVAGTDGVWGTPDDEYGDLRLFPGSPCIDAGDNFMVPANVLIDLDGEARFVDDPMTPDRGSGSAPLVDMGGYEFHVDACQADVAPIGGDGAVNVDDLFAIIAMWGDCPAAGPCSADIAPVGGDGIVNIDDLFVVVASWGACP